MYFQNLLTLGRTYKSKTKQKQNKNKTKTKTFENKIKVSC